MFLQSNMLGHVLNQLEYSLILHNQDVYNVNFSEQIFHNYFEIFI
jgi:hypothetical protein